MKNILKVPEPAADCPVTHCLKLIGGKWKPLLLFCISNEVDRFGAMQRAVPAISKQMLTKQLRELEADGLVTRTVFPEVPPRVEYSLSDRGGSALGIIDAMRRWGDEDMQASRQTAAYAQN